MAINPESVDVVLVPDLEGGLPNSSSLFVFSDSLGNLKKLTRDQFLAFVSVNSGASKTTLNTSAGVPVVINWATDIDPNGDGVMTYGQRHGFNVVPVVVASYLVDGIYTTYTTNYSYTANVGGVLVLTIPDTFTGKLTII